MNDEVLTKLYPDSISLGSMDDDISRHHNYQTTIFPDNNISWSQHFLTTILLDDPSWQQTTVFLTSWQKQYAGVDYILRESLHLVASTRVPQSVTYGRCICGYSLCVLVIFELLGDEIFFSKRSYAHLYILVRSYFFIWWGRIYFFGDVIFIFENTSI